LLSTDKPEVDFWCAKRFHNAPKERRNNAYILHFDADQTAQQPSSGGRSRQILGKRSQNTELT
jgi:hypothetical protein